MSRASNDFRRGSASTLRRARAPQKRRHSLASLDWHACRHEELEDRRLLAVVPFASIGTQLRSDLLTVENQLTVVLNNFDTGTSSTIPFVGERLGDITKAFSGFSTQIQASLTSLGSPTDPSPAILQTALFNALGPSGLNILGDRNGNGADSADVVVTAAGGVLNDDFSVQMRLSGSIAAPSVPLKFNTGLPGLPLSIRSDGALVAAVTFSYELAFTYDAQMQTVDLDDSKKLAGANHQLALAASIGLQNFSATAILGFVQGDLTAIPGQPNGLSLAVELNNISTAPQVVISGSADANLRLSGSFAGTENDFPGIDSDLHLHWVIDTENPSAAAPDVWFDNVYLDLGDFISNVVKPVFETVHQFTQPLAPVLEVLGYPLPGLTDLSRLVGGGDVTLLDLGGVAATVTGFGPLYDLVEKVLEVIDAINQFEVGDSVRLKLGGFDLDSFDLRNVAAAGNPLNTSLRNLTELSPSNLIGIAQSLASKIDDLPIGNEEKEFLKGFAEQLNNGFSVRFPILEDPASAVFPMLLGRDGDLFTLDAEVHQNAKGSVATGFSVFGIGVDFGGEVEVDTKFKFAYDTFGIRNLISDIAAGNTSAATIAEDIVDGFYLASDSFFELAGTIYAAAGAGIGIFSARVGGFVSTGDSGDEPVSITIVDPNNDGKLRFSEFSEDSFEFSGELAAELGVEVRVGVEILNKFIGVKKRFNMAREILIDFNLDPNDPTDPSDAVLASQPDANGNINLYIGPLAHLREEVDNEDGDEQLRIQHVETTPAGETIDITIRQRNFLGREFDVTQRIAGVKKITGIDGIGNLLIDVLPGVTSDVHFEGGSGHAELMYEGLGIAYLKAGALDSALTGGIGNNTLIGGLGNDTISLGHAGNTVTGGAGNNTIIVNAPTTQGGSVVGGDTSNNMLVVSAGQYTSSIDLVTDSPGFMRLAYDETQGTYPNLILSKFNQVSVTAQDRNTDIHVGDLSPAGIETVIVNVPTVGQGGRKIELDTRYQGGTSDITLQPFDHVYSTPDGGTISQRAMLLANNTTGVETYILGVAANDITTIVQHGGVATLGPLGNDNGTIVFDTRQRSAGADEAVFMHVPSDVDGNIVEMGDSGSNDFKIDPQLYPTIVFKGLATIDRIEMDLDAPTDEDGTNSITIDASALQGLLDLDLLGTAGFVPVTNAVTISELALGGVIDVDGGATSATLNCGTGKLFDIQGDVRAHNLELTIDDHDALIPSLIVLGVAAAQRRTSPDDGLRPGLTYDGLRGKFTVHAGAGDRIGLEQTAPGISQMKFTNPSNTLDSLYVEAASSKLSINGNWSLYFGREMLADGTVVRTGKLAPIGVQVDAVFTGSTPREIVFDAIHDPIGAQHNLGGDGIVEYTRFVDSTLGLHLKAEGTKLADDLFLYLTGAEANIDVTPMAGIEITVDSNDRFAGVNPTAPNTVSLEVKFGTVTMTPIGEYDSRIVGGNPVNILATIPQDTTNVGIASTINAGPLKDNPAVVFAFGTDFIFADAYYLAHVTDGYWPLVGEVEFRDAITNLSAYYEANFPDLTNKTLPAYGINVPVMGGGFGYSQIWLNPNSNYNPPLPTGAMAEGLLYPVDFDPWNSTMNLNASQLRGTFNVNVHDPDYAAANRIGNFFDQIMQYRYDVSTVSPYYQNIENNYPRFAIKFGTTDVNLTHVGPETSANINGSAPLVQNQDTPLMLKGIYGTVTNAQTNVNLGVGDLSSIDGAVSFNRVHLTIDGRNGTTPNILTMNGSTLSGWSTGAPGVTQTASFGTLYGTLTMIGGVADSFSILQTPVGPSKISVQGGVAAGPLAMSMAVAADSEPVAESMADDDGTPGVYLVGKQLNQIFEVNGNFEFTIGRKLNGDGSVEVASGITGFTNFVNNTHDQHTISYNFTGEGKGTLVYDVSSAITFGPTLIVGSDAAYAGKGVLVFDWGSTLTRNKLVYSPNTDLTILAPQRQIALIENYVDATIRFFLNPLNTTNFLDEVRVGAAYGPVFVTGRGATSFVTIIPPQFSNGRLDDTIRAAVTVTDAALRVISDNTTSTGGPLLNVVLTANSLTGLTQAPIYFERLTDFTPNFTSPQPGLHIGLPKQGAASLTIVDTPAGVRTAINTFEGSGTGQVTVQATTGPLLLGSTDIFNQSFARREFRADSVTFGSGGSLQNIRGNVTTGGSSRYVVPGGTVLDNRIDAAREVLLGELAWTGLAPAAFEFPQTLSSEFTILGSEDSHYRVEIVRNKVNLMAGVGTTVEIAKPSYTSTSMPYRMKVYGAEQVLVNPDTSNPSTSTDGTFTVLPHPDRPTQTTELIVDFRSVAYPVFIDNAGGGLGEFWGGNIPFKNTYVKFQGNTTHFTLLGFNRTDWQVDPWSYPIQVLDTVALSTTINPGNRLLEVLGTSNPLTIEHDGPQKVTLGNAGNMQNMHGPITVNVHNTASAPVVVELNSSADSTARNITLGHPAANQWIVSGLAPLPVAINGALARPSLRGGVGANTLTGPNVATTWDITSASGGLIAGLVSFSGIRSLVGGSAADDFYFRGTGQLAGNLDGGDGFDTAHYMGILNGSETIDLPGGILPRVGGLAVSIEAIDVVAVLAVQNPGNQIGRIGLTITPLQIVATGGDPNKTYSATGLPTGLSIHPSTGIISGTVSSSIVIGTNFNVNVTVNDGSTTKNVAFIWNVQDVYSVVNPGNQLTPEGVPISLQIQVDNPTNRQLRFDANGLPSYLSIHPQTGVISGSIYFYTQQYGSNIQFNANVFVYDDAAQKVKTVSFTWKLQPGFQLWNGTFYDYAGETIDFPVVTNPYNHTITVSATGLPPGLSMDSSGRIIGTIDDFAFRDEAYVVQMTAFDQNINYTATQTLTWFVSPAMALYPPAPQFSYAGMNAEFYVSFQNALAHEFTIDVTNLPPGLTVDEFGTISGTIDASASADSPYLVTLTLTDTTIGRTMQETFEWTVLPPISIDDLNANTPPGTPILVDVFDPMAGEHPRQMVAVHYPSQPEGTESLYVFADRLYVIENGQRTAVVSIDQDYSEIGWVTDLLPVPGRGVMFLDNLNRLWFADQAGARVIYEDPLYLNLGSGPISLGDSLYLGTYDAFTFSAQVTQIDFSGPEPQVSHLDTGNINGIEGIHDFAGGLVYNGYETGNSYRSIYWYNPVTGDTITIGGIAAAFNDVTVVPATDGTQNLFTLARPDYDLPSQLRVINSAALSGPNPELTTLTEFAPGSDVGGSNWPQQPIHVTGNKVSFSVRTYDGGTGEYSFQFWTSDGTVAGTGGLSSFMMGRAQITEQIAFAGSVYFLFDLETPEVTEDTVAAQLWKFDPTSGELSLLHDFVGELFMNESPYALTAAGEFFYFAASNGVPNEYGLWRFKNGDVAPSLVPSKAGNAYLNPIPSEGVLVGDRFYFVAESAALPDQDGYYSRQLWSVGPPVTVSIPGDLTGDGTVDATDIDAIWGLVQSGNPAADLNGDGSVNQADVDYLIRVIMNTEYGDANLDGFVDAADLAVTRQRIGSQYGGPNWLGADFNGDGIVDAVELATVRQHMGFVGANAVPVGTQPLTEEMIGNDTRLVIDESLDHDFEDLVSLLASGTARRRWRLTRMG